MKLHRRFATNVRYWTNIISIIFIYLWATGQNPQVLYNLTYNIQRQCWIFLNRSTWKIDVCWTQPVKLITWKLINIRTALKPAYSTSSFNKNCSGRLCRAYIYRLWNKFLKEVFALQPSSELSPNSKTFKLLAWKYLIVWQ